MKYIKQFESYSVDPSILDQLISGELVTKNPKDVSGLLIKIEIDGHGNHLAISDLPELKGMEFQYQYSNGTYALKRIK